MERNKVNPENNDGEVPLRDVGEIEEGLNVQQNDGNSCNNNRRQNKKLCSCPRLLKVTLITVAILLCASVIIFCIVYFMLERNYKKEAPLTSKLTPPNPDVELPPSSSTLHIFTNGAVCSDSDICSQIGRDVFYRGGNVMDATIATLFCVGLTTMQSMGLGGGFLMNIFNKTENKAYTLDAKEVAPLAATRDMFVGKPVMASMSGPLSIGVPGEVMGYWEAHKRFGSMTWKEIIEPSIKVCQDGFPISQHMSDALSFNKRVKNDTNLRTMFWNETSNDFYRIGTKVYPPHQLCSTYRRLATNGGPDFYRGNLAKILAEDLQDIESIITLKDLQEYSVSWSDSIPIRLNNNIMYVIPPPGSGTLLALIMNIIKGFNLTESNFSTVNGTIQTYHRIIEAYKYAFGKRSELGDLKFNNLTLLMANLTSSDFADLVRQQIHDDVTYDDIKHYGAQFWSKSEHGTSHMSIIGPSGDAISVTSSINFYFGSGHSGERTGILFNSGMNDFSTPGVANFFSLPSSVPNYIEPKKRAMSSMCPTIVTDKHGEVSLVIGAAGGSKIPTSVAWVIALNLWMNKDIKEAIDAPRFHHQLAPNILEYEYGILQDVITGLEGKGHNTLRYRQRSSTMCGVAKSRGTVYANADYRKKGGVSGL